MKKFLIFLVVTIVTVCIGMTFYQFAKNDEVIKVTNQTLYINYGDKLSLDDIGFSRKEASKDTKINFNAGGEEVTSIIKYDEVSNCYIPTPKGGSTTIKISTTNRKYKTLTIDVVVGIGTEECPYYISNEEQLFSIGAVYDLNACYKLINDIEISQTHTPIGFIDGNYHEFGGQFNGNYRTISNLKVDTCDFGGLFAIMGANSSVYNLSIKNAVLQGSFINVGTVAGICYGNINKVVVSNATINNDRTLSNTGAVVGLLQTDSLNNVTASMLRTSAYTDNNSVITANGNLGGLAGTVNSAVVHACYTNLSLTNTSTAVTGGLVGQLLVNRDTYIRESYSISNIQANGVAGNIAGDIALNSNTQLTNVTKELVLVGLYFDNTINNLNGVGNDINGFASATTFAVNGKTTVDLKTKSNYVYYVNSANTIIYWDRVWNLVDGEYPTLTFVSNFDDVVLNGDNNQTTPDNPSTPDITDPENPNANAIVISTKQDLVNKFQTGNEVTGNYILNANIDLDGMTWTPVTFSGSLKSSDDNKFTISNFTLNSDKWYVGFFYTLSNATIANITFNNVQVVENGANETAGILVGYIPGNVTIENISVTNATILSATKYAGAIAGYIGNSLVTINNCHVNNFNLGQKALNVGGVTGYSSANTYINNTYIQSGILVGVDRVGGINAVNYGTVNNSTFAGTITSASNASAAGYFGGLTAVNYESGSFTNCIANAEISVTNNNSSTSTYYFVGGLCAYNMGKFNFCETYATEYTGNKSTNNVYIGGLTAYNKGLLEYCLANITKISDARAYMYVAGLSVYNYGGKIYGCMGLGNLNGYQVAGLVLINSNNGTVDSCLAGQGRNLRATYKGEQVVGLVFDISSGTVTNCLVNANLECISTTGWVAGFAGFMHCNGDKFGTIAYSIANVTISGTSKQLYLDIAQEGLMYKTRTTGTITNCVISKDAKVDDVIVSEYSKTLWITHKPASGSNYVIATTTEMQSIETYLDVNKCDFDIASGDGNSTWVYFGNTLLPAPRAIMEIINK